LRTIKRIEKPTFDGEVLLCEDNKMNRDIICEHLAKVGLKIVVAENGMEGVKAFRNRVQNNGRLFDLVFMDIQMPVMDGLEAGAEISKLNTGTPIIAMTANSSLAHREEYAAHGMPDCVNKPFTSQELWDCLLKYLTPVNQDTLDKSKTAESDESLQHRLIRNFINENKNKYNEILSAIGSGDIKLANRLAHSLKSNAGYLGKEALQNAALNVETLLKDENNLTTPDVLNTLNTELDTVLKELTALEIAIISGGAAVPRVSAYIDAEWKKGLINKLEQLLDCGNPECLSLIDDLRAMPGSEELIDQMENFNFDVAKGILDQLKLKWR
jgi:CheY-like chemotaxis protein